MLKIKLSPVGKKNDKHYRIVVMEGKSKLTGPAVAVLGHYHPLQKSDKLVVNIDQVKAWMAKGATMTPTMHELLKV